MGKKFLLLILIVLIGSAFTSCASPKDKATKLFYAYENDFEKAKNTLLAERKALGVKKLSIVGVEIRSKLNKDVSPDAQEQIKKCQL